MKNRCLVVGANGFIGSHIVDALAAKGHFVTAFDRFSRPQQFRDSPLVKVVAGDFQDQEKMRSVLEEVRCVFHYLWTTNPRSSVEKGPVYEVETNLIPTLNLLEFSAKNGVETVIFPSTSTVYGSVSALPVTEDHPLNPETPHAIAKVAVEKFLAYYSKIYGLESYVLRIGNAYGPRQDPFGGLGFINAVLGQLIKREKPVIFGDGSITRDFVSVEDVVRANLAVLEIGANCRVMNLSSGRGWSLNAILAKISEVLATEIEVEYSHRRTADIPKVILSIKRISQELGYRPRVGIEEGITKTWEWVKETYK